MTDLWYQNPSILLSDLDQFFPSNNLTRNQKINSMARFAIYLSGIILLMRQDSRFLSVSILILAVSWFLGQTEKFTSGDPNLNPDKSCQKPTDANPFMNYTVGELIDSNDRPGACPYDLSKFEMRNEFRSKTVTDTSDLWGKFISDRNYYSMPNTEIVNDQIGFAKWIFGESGQCKVTGTNCLKERDPVYHRGRMTNIDDQN